MNILITINTNYLLMCKDMLMSLYINNKEPLNIYLIYKNLPKEQLKELQHFISNNKIGKLFPIKFNLNITTPLNIDYISIETYYRLYAPFLLPDHLERILYLDADIICNGNIKELYNMNFDNNILIGCENFDANNSLYNERLKLPPNNIYINAGVLLINLKKYKEFTTINNLNNFIQQNHNILYYQDQDVINKLFFNHIKHTDIKYNYQINMIINNISPTRILTHYTTKDKPWNDNYSKPNYAIDFYNYLENIKDNQRLKYYQNKHNSTLISIIVPIYNVEKYLKKCLDTIITQSQKNIEILLIDDGSTDKSGEICDQYKKIDKRITVIHQTNQGLSSARNKGLEISKGKYIGFVDADDYIDINMYKYMYNYLEKNNLDIVVCNFYHIYDNTTTIPDKNNNQDQIFNNKEQILIETLKDDTIRNFVWSKLYKKELWNQIRFPIDKVYEDISISIPIAEKSNRIGYISKPLYYYNHRSNSISKTNSIENIKDSINNSYKRYKYINKKYKNLYIYNLESMINRICCEYFERKNYLDEQLFFKKFQKIITELQEEYDKNKKNVKDIKYNFNYLINKNTQLNKNNNQNLFTNTK